MLAKSQIHSAVNGVSRIRGLVKTAELEHGTVTLVSRSFCKDLKEDI